MKKLAAVLILAAFSAGAQAQGPRPVYYGTNGGNLNYNYNRNYNNNYIAPVIAGAVIGAIVGQIIQPQPRCYTTPVTNYVPNQWGQMVPVTQMQTVCN